MTSRDSMPVLIYDGDCAFCSSSVRFIQDHIRRHPRCEPWQWLDLDVYGDRFGLTRDDCERSVQFIDLDGTVHAAELAVARVLLYGGRGWAVLGRTLLLPGVRHLAGIVYRWIAKNRHRMPGGTPQCSMSPEQRAETSKGST
ncbi:MAG: thiol-disulfide oxidoreductase DCC family protein [Actinomycetota bacterium]